MRKRELDTLPKRRELGFCRVDDCDKELLHMRQTLTHVVRETPLYLDGTPNLLPHTEGEVVMRIFEIDEVCADGHKVSWERHVRLNPNSMIETPFVITVIPKVFDSEKGWHIEMRTALNS